jgi:hypothetical protein
MTRTLAALLCAVASSGILAQAGTLTIDGTCTVYFTPQPVGSSPTSVLGVEHFPNQCDDLYPGVSAGVRYDVEERLSVDGNEINFIDYTSAQLKGLMSASQNNPLVYPLSNLIVTMADSALLEVVGGEGEGVIRGYANLYQDGIGGWGSGSITAPGFQLHGAGGVTGYTFTLPFTFNVPFLLEFTSTAWAGPGPAGGTGCLDACSGDMSVGMSSSGIYDASGVIIPEARVVFAGSVPEPSTLWLSALLPACLLTRWLIRPGLTIGKEYAAIWLHSNPGRRVSSV